jgi:hypothetical protein
MQANQTNCNSCGAVISLLDAYIKQTPVLRGFYCSESCARKHVRPDSLSEFGTILILPPPDYNAKKLSDAQWQPIIIREDDEM